MKICIYSQFPANTNNAAQGTDFETTSVEFPPNSEGTEGIEIGSILEE